MIEVSDQTEKCSLLFTLKTGLQPQYEVKDVDAARELLDRVARQSAAGTLIASFFYGVEQEKVGAIQIDQILYAVTLIGHGS